MTDKALSACPFCGKSVATVATASELKDEDVYEHSESYAVFCDASSPNGPGGCGASGGFFPTEDEAIAAWNRRAPEWVSVDDRLPCVPNGHSREFIVACKRAHDGKTYVFAAEYLNGRLLLTDDEDCPEWGKPFTGWYQERSDDSDYDSAFHAVCNTGDEVTHWQPLPAAPQPPKDAP